MKCKLITLFVFISTLFALAAAPAVLSVAEGGTDGTQLTGLLAWPAQSGATFDAYAYKSEDPTCAFPSPAQKQLNAVPIQNNASGNSFIDNTETADSLSGYQGSWCYGVSSVIGGVESAITPAASPLYLGLKWYFQWGYRTGLSDGTCGAQISNSTFQGGTLTLTKNGVIMPQVGPVKGGAYLWEWAGHLRLKSTDTLVIKWIDPDGIHKHTYTNPFIGLATDGLPLYGDAQPYLDVHYNQANDSICYSDKHDYEQRASDN